MAECNKAKQSNAQHIRVKTRQDKDSAYYTKHSTAQHSILRMQSPQYQPMLTTVSTAVRLVPCMSSPLTAHTRNLEGNSTIPCTHPQPQPHNSLASLVQQLALPAHLLHHYEDDLGPLERALLLAVGAMAPVASVVMLLEAVRASVEATAMVVGVVTVPVLVVVLRLLLLVADSDVWVLGCVLGRVLVWVLGADFVVSEAAEPPLAETTVCDDSDDNDDDNDDNADDNADDKPL